MRIFERIFLSIIFWLFNVYDNWKHPKRFKVGDNVRDSTRTGFWQDLTIVEYDFYYDGYWWVAAKDNIFNGSPIPFRDSELELIFKEMPYDPTQMGDREDDI